MNNDLYLELAKLDYNNCQTLHLIEWDNIQKYNQTKALLLLKLTNCILLIFGTLILHIYSVSIIFRWCAECKLEDYGLTSRSLLMAYFVAAASIFEPERSNERLAWAKSRSLIETVGSHFKEETSEQRSAFVHVFRTKYVNTTVLLIWSFLVLYILASRIDFSTNSPSKDI